MTKLDDETSAASTSRLAIPSPTSSQSGEGRVVADDEAPPEPVVLEPVVAPRLRNVGRRIRAFAGWALLGTFFFLLFAWLALPTKAIAWRISHEAYKAGYNLHVEDVSVRPWGLVRLHNVKWTYEPTRDGVPPQSYFIKSLDARVRPLPYLTGGVIDVTVYTERESGHIYAHYIRNDEVSQVELEIKDVQLYDIPKATQAIGVPLMGTVGLNVDLKLPEHSFEKATGSIDLTCLACSGGDGESKLFVPGAKSSLSKDGLTIPQIDLGSVKGRFVVKNGQATLEPSIEADSEDLTLSITGAILLRDPVTASQFAMKIKVALSEAFLAESERVEFMYNGASANSKLDPPEEGLGFKLMGNFGKPKFYGIKATTPWERRAAQRGAARKRDARRRRPRARKRRRNTRPPTPAVRRTASDDRPDDGSEDQPDDRRDDDERDEPEEPEERDEPEPIDDEPEPEPEPVDDRPDGDDENIEIDDEEPPLDGDPPPNDGGDNLDDEGDSGGPQQ